MKSILMVIPISKYMCVVIARFPCIELMTSNHGDLPSKRFYWPFEVKEFSSLNAVNVNEDESFAEHKIFINMNRNLYI